jgi:RNA polymerase sigma-70 factor, ECF subfamily
MANTYSMKHRDPRPDVWPELHGRLRAFVGRRVPESSAADDIAQDIMLRLVNQIGRLRQQDRLDAWAYQVARNAIADYWRDRAATREQPLDGQLSERLASMPEHAGSDEAESLRAQVAHCLAPMIKRLSDPYREAIRLTALGADTQAVAAARLGLSVPGMKARVQRARAQLRELLAACCLIELDRLGAVTNFEPRSGRACSCHDSS